MIRKNLALLGTAATALTASGFALATEPAVDVADAVAAIDGGVSAVAAIGGAALVVLAGAVVFKLVRRAM